MWFIIFLIPLISIFISYKWFNHEVTKEEYVCQFIIPILLSLIFYFTFTYFADPTWDSEYLNGYVTKVTYEEEWNEYIHRTCTRTTGSGKNQITTTYDCSYVDYHPPKWYADTTLGRVNLRENTYARLVQQFGNNSKVGHHSGYTIDGDIFASVFDGTRDKLEPYQTIHHYHNYVQASNSVFNFRELSYKEKEGLYTYPEIKGLSTSSVFGGRSKELNVLNALFGEKYQINILILLFHNKSYEISELQRQFWKNGNKNELVVCIGLNEGMVDWCNVWSWCENDTFLIECREKIIEQHGKQLDLISFVSYLEYAVPQGWKQKNFEDFNYIEIEYPLWISFTMIFLQCVFSGLICFFSIKEHNFGLTSMSPRIIRNHTRFRNKK